MSRPTLSSPPRLTAAAASERAKIIATEKIYALIAEAVSNGEDSCRIEGGVWRASGWSESEQDLVKLGYRVDVETDDRCCLSHVIIIWTEN